MRVSGIRFLARRNVARSNSLCVMPGLWALCSGGDSECVDLLTIDREPA